MSAPMDRDGVLADLYPRDLYALTHSWLSDRNPITKHEAGRLLEATLNATGDQRDKTRAAITDLFAQRDGLVALANEWDARSREALPADAMLINKHVRELRAALARSTP